VALSTVVFLGPSLPHSEAKKILEAEFRPPIRRGDLPTLPEDVRLVGIIDGVFMSEAAVGHREIVTLLKRGTKVVGGGSMGALRASELESFGMRGVGRIFELYLSGQVEGDDEVALIFHPETLEALSEPLVNIRLNLTRAVEAGIVSESDASFALERMKQTYFPKRSIALLLNVLSEGAGEDVARNLKTYIDAEYEDFKRKDALEVLSTLRKMQENAKK
jgi:hypothetical protein